MVQRLGWRRPGDGTPHRDRAARHKTV